MGFYFEKGRLFCDGVKVEEIVAKTGTPIFLYSFDELKARVNDLKQYIDPTILAYAVKSNGTLAILNYIKELGSTFDVGSLGEFKLLQRIGADPMRSVFSGLGKTPECLDAIISNNIGFISIDDPGELRKIDQVASKLSKKIKVLFRINPDIDAKTHKYITTGLYQTKFGMDETGFSRSLQMVKESSCLQFSGIHIHIGSQVGGIEPFSKVVDYVLKLSREVKFEYVDLGGGFPIPYDSKPLGVDIKSIGEEYRKLKNSGMKIIIEPGRYIVGNAGILITSVILNKKIGKKNFLVCNTGMNSLIRPPLYDAKHTVLKLNLSSAIDQIPWNVDNIGNIKYDVVGPICENTDFFARDINLDEVKEGEPLAIFSAGGYGCVLSSNYNGYPKLAQYGVMNSRLIQLTKAEDCNEIVRNDLLI
ncbi:MAG: diaminopimelate decarboxylase [Planctomycetes bacterium]|nr:diaminopimelate decarboxylase [Planctomycetota bacterium]